jgi:AcrR family transcriptional regulator
MEEAIAEVACDKGLAATTVADVVKRARVSRRTFYEHFRDKDDCFLEAYRTAMQFVVGRLDAERDRVDPHDWRGRVRVGLEAYIGTVEEEPRFTRFVLVESRAGDERVAELRSEVYARFTDQYAELNRLAVAQDPDARPVHRGLLMLLVAGLGDVSAEYVRRGDIDALRDMLEPLVELHEAVVSGRVVSGRVVSGRVAAGRMAAVAIPAESSPAR